MQKLGNTNGESKIVTIRVTDEQAQWLESKGNKSQVIRDLIDSFMNIDN